ncbi:hypothetical protein HDU67_008329 [Dinochytrium kinnereticum]|nr:hypothetical protein HDU67_008329 [Dinochytrium kinnereticum]
MKETIKLPSLRHIGASGLSVLSDIAAPPLSSDGEIRETVGGWEGVLRTFSLPNLERVDGMFQMKNLLALEDLNVGKLTRVEGFGINTAPRLQSISFPAGLNSTGSSFTVVDTGVTGPSLTGLAFSQSGTIDITSNPNLQDLSLPSLTQVLGNMKVALNGRSSSRREQAGGGSLVEADKLEKVNGDMILNWVSGVSMNMLTSVAGNLEVTEGSPNMTSLEFPKLTDVGKSVTVRSNLNLSQMRLPALSTVSGNIALSDSPSLSNLSADDFVPSLTSVGGSINISLPGSLQTFALPASSPKVGGSLVVEGSDSLDCDALKRSAAMASMNLRDSVSCSTTSSIPDFPSSGGNTSHRLPSTMSGGFRATRSAGASPSSTNVSGGPLNNKTSSSGAWSYDGGRESKTSVVQILFALWFTGLCWIAFV